MSAKETGQPNFYPFSSHELIVRTAHGFNIAVDGNDIGVTPALIFDHCYELPEEKFVKQILRGGDWALNVGSNAGVFACWLHYV